MTCELAHREPFPTPAHAGVAAAEVVVIEPRYRRTPPKLGLGIGVGDQFAPTGMAAAKLIGRGVLSDDGGGRLLSDGGGGRLAAHQ